MNFLIDQKNPQSLGITLYKDFKAPTGNRADSRALRRVALVAPRLAQQAHDGRIAGQNPQAIPAAASSVEPVERLPMPSIDGIAAGESLTVQWPTGLHALMAFLQPDVLVERLLAEINRIANTPCPLAQREQRIAKLEEEIDRLHAAKRPLSSPPVRHANADARHGSC